MLDRATIERLSKTPEKNAPMLNVALAEEGTAPVLLALAGSHAVGPEALSVIAERVAAEGDAVGRDPDAAADEPFEPVAAELDRLLISHPRVSGEPRDAVLGRHEDDAFFVLAAASHPQASLAAIERAVDWPSASPVHDRLWLALLDATRVPPLTLEEWGDDPSPLRREAAARLARDAALLVRLAADPHRRVRRAVASNRSAADLRAALAESDVAPEVRARAAGPLGSHDSPLPEGAKWVESARFAAALRAMHSGGVLAPDVTRALASAGAPLDEEGARIAAQVLPRSELGSLVEQLVAAGIDSRCSLQLAAGLALRPPALALPPGVSGRHSPAVSDTAEEDAAEHTEIIYDTVKTLSRTTTAESRLTGKARLAAWAAEGLATVAGLGSPPPSDLAVELARAPLGADRMVLARGATRRPALVRELCGAAEHIGHAGCEVPAALLELAWTEPGVEERELLDLAARLARPKKRAEDLPEDEIDLEPQRRPLEVLERVVVTVTLRANVSPRAALAVVALDARRVRYILSAMPQWKGRLTGGRLARVLRQHAGALSAAHAEARARHARVETWTERRLSEVELAIALAVGHLTGAEVARRIEIGRLVVEDGLSLASGIEARAALEGAASVAPLLSWATQRRSQVPAALAMWLLLERLERERAPSMVSASLDALAAAPAPSGSAGKGVVAASVCDALALLERRTPGRLETIHPQSPRGRATLASAIARAYRAVGGMAHERVG